MTLSTSNLKIRFLDPYWIVFCFLSIFTLLIVWSNTYLPLMDLPEHVAQVSIARHFNDPTTSYSTQYYFDWTTPYLTGIVLASGLSYLIGVFPAVKLVLSLAILALPLSILYLTKRTHGDRWWSLIGFPLGFGYNYVLGHLNFMVAMPLSILFLTWAMETSESFSYGNLMRLFFLSCGLWISHGYLYVITVILASPFFLSHTEKKSLFWKLGLYAVLLTWPLIWWINTSPVEINYRAGSLFDLNPNKFLVLPNYLLAENRSLSSFLHALGLLIVLFLGGRLTTTWVRWMPLAIVIAAYYFLPYNVRGAAHFGFQRIVFLLIPSLIIALSFSGKRFGNWTIPHFILIGLSLSWLWLSYTRAQSFNEECVDFEKVVQKIELHKKVLPLLYRQRSDEADGRSFRYFSAYLTEIRFAKLPFSFAMQPPQWIRKKIDPATYKLIRKLHWEPNTFIWTEDQDYDYYLVHWPYDLSARLFSEAGNTVQKIAHEGDWWLYKTRDKEVNRSVLH